MKRRGPLVDYVRLGTRALNPQILARPALQKLPDIKLPPGYHSSSTGEVIGPEEEVARQIAERVRQQYGTVYPKVTVTFAQLPNAASTQTGGSFTLAEEYSQDKEAICALIAHHVARLILTQMQISLPSEEENGKLADAVATFAGFGPILRTAYYRETKWTAGDITYTRVTKLGSLQVGEIDALSRVRARVAAREIRHRQCPIRRWDTQRVECPVCYNYMGLPEVGGRLRLKCRVCHCEQEVRLETGPRRGWRQLSGTLSRPVLYVIDACRGL